MAYFSDVPYQTINGREVRGWSVMACRSDAPHKPHCWDSDYMSFGPYACPGADPIPIRKIVKESGVS